MTPGSDASESSARFYLRMSGGTGAYTTGAVEELMKLAIEQGSVTPAEIAEVLGCEELTVDYKHEWSVGEE